VNVACPRPCSPICIPLNLWCAQWYLLYGIPTVYIWGVNRCVSRRIYKFIKQSSRFPQYISPIKIVGDAHKFFSRTALLFYDVIIPFGTRWTSIIMLKWNWSNTELPKTCSWKDKDFRDTLNVYNISHWIFGKNGTVLACIAENQRIEFHYVMAAHIISEKSHTTSYIDKRTFNVLIPRSRIIVIATI